jgi:hypothetical protein
MSDYFRERGFSDGAVKAVGWRIEQLDGRAQRYGLPAEAGGIDVWVLPYRHRNGQVAFERIRLIADADLERFGRAGKYRQPAGRKLALYDPYGVLGYEGPLDCVVLIEGEANAVAVREMAPDLPIVGLPGQAALKEALAEELGHVPLVLLWLDRQDKGFERNAAIAVERLTSAGVEDVRVIEDTHAVDANDLLRMHGVDLGGRELRGLIERAASFIPADERARAQQPPLALEPNLLSRFGEELARCGLVGEERAAKLAYLAMTSRLLDQPVSIALKGPSAGGKSFLVETVLRFLPDSAFYELTGGSERAFAYSDEPLMHRVLVIYEAAGMTGDWASYLIRSLLSEGRIRYETVEKTKDGMRARMIEREGPTALACTTTRVRLHPENETRLLSIPVTDTAEQTKAVMRALANDDRCLPDLSEWIGLQRWIAGAESTVSIPYGAELSELIPAVAVRLRRDFSSLLGLISAHALLHQATRERDGRGRVVATIGDYAVVRELVAGLISDAVGATVRPETRETVEAVRNLAAEHTEGVPQSALAKALNLDRGPVSRRVRVAIDRGYLTNREDRRGRPARLVLGDPLPDEQEILPRPEALEANRCTVARDSWAIKREVLAA